MDAVEVVAAHRDCATVRIGDVFLKLDGDQARSDREVEAMARAPIPTPEVLWRRPPVLALRALRGSPLARLGEPSTASAAAWRAAGATVRALHDTPLPPWPGRGPDDAAADLDRECTWLLAHDVLPADLVGHNRRRAETVLRPWSPVFVHGDLHVAHVFVDGDEITGVLDWTEAAAGDPLFDLAVLTLGHPDHLDDVVAGYRAGSRTQVDGSDRVEVEVDLIQGWWSWRCLVAVRWLIEHGFDPFTPGGEVDVLRSQL